MTIACPFLMARNALQWFGIDLPIRAAIALSDCMGAAQPGIYAHQPPDR
ncbi:hypothetical protein [Sedimentitalea sp.]